MYKLLYGVDRCQVQVFVILSGRDYPFLFSESYLAQLPYISLF